MDIIKNVPSVNFHLWQQCNMKCGYCFGKFVDTPIKLSKAHLTRNETFQIIKELANAGFTKINFAGGEPLLCTWLRDLIVLSHESGMTTSIVTNGTKLKKEWIQQLSGKLDWAALSIDSKNANTNKRLGL